MAILKSREEKAGLKGIIWVLRGDAQRMGNYKAYKGGSGMDIEKGIGIIDIC